MAFAAGNGGGIATGLIMGGFLCLGLVFAAIAGTVILSLISIYTPSHGVDGYGDQYQINPLMLKTLYTNSSNNFTNSTIATNTALNTLCANTFTAQGSETPYGCVVDQHYGWGPDSNDAFNTKRRRRTYGYSALYSVARGRIFYYTTCGVQSDKSKYYNNATSNCVRARLAACNALFNSSAAQNLSEWTPVSSMSYSIVNNPTVSYVVLAIYKIFGVRSSTAIAKALSVGVTGYDFTSGCQYIGPIARSDMAAIISSQSSQTTTQPTSTQYTG